MLKDLNAKMEHGEANITVTIDAEDGFNPSDYELTITYKGELFITRRSQTGEELGSQVIDLGRVY